MSSPIYQVALEDKSSVFNTSLSDAGAGRDDPVRRDGRAIGLGPQGMRGAHQRLDHDQRDDVNYLKHSMAHYNPNGDPRIDYLDVVITKSQPAERVSRGRGGQVA